MKEGLNDSEPYLTAGSKNRGSLIYSHLAEQMQKNYELRLKRRNEPLFYKIFSSSQFKSHA